jgi:hypothetical protein
MNPPAVAGTLSRLERGGIEFAGAPCNYTKQMIVFPADRTREL